MDNEITTEKIENAVGKIVSAIKPEKIILFGSWAWGTPGPDSDVDLLVVKETTVPRLQRQTNLLKELFPPEIPMDILVYTQDELNNKIKLDRNLFLEDIIANGKILYAA